MIWFNERLIEFIDCFEVSLHLNVSITKNDYGASLVEGGSLWKVIVLNQHASTVRLMRQHSNTHSDASWPFRLVSRCQ